MSHRTHPDGVPAPHRTTRAMFQPFLKSHAGEGVVKRPAKAVSPPQVAVKRLGVKSGPCSKWTSRTPHRAFTAASASIRTRPTTIMPILFLNINIVSPHAPLFALVADGGNHVAADRPVGWCGKDGRNADGGILTLQPSLCASLPCDEYIIIPRSERKTKNRRQLLCLNPTAVPGCRGSSARGPRSPRRGETVRARD